MTDEKIEAIAEKWNGPDKVGQAVPRQYRRLMNALRELAADHDAEVTRLKDEHNETRDVLADIVDTNRALKERLAAADALLTRSRRRISDALEMVIELHDPDEDDVSGEQEFIAELDAHLAQLPASEAAGACTCRSAKSPLCAFCQGQRDQPSQPAPDVTAQLENLREETDNRFERLSASIGRRLTDAILRIDELDKRLSTTCPKTLLAHDFVNDGKGRCEFDGCGLSRESVFHPSRPAPDVTAQPVTDPIAALRAEVEQLQLDAIRDRYTQQKVCEALQYGVERLDSLMVIEGQRTDRLESRVAALEPKAGWQIVYGPMASRPVPEPPLVTHTSEALRKLSSSVHQAITEAIDETRDMAERMDNRNLPQLDHCYVRPPLGVDDFCCFSVAFNTPCGLPESRHKMRDE